MCVCVSVRVHCIFISFTLCHSLSSFRYAHKYNMSIILLFISFFIFMKIYCQLFYQFIVSVSNVNDGDDDVDDDDNNMHANSFSFIERVQSWKVCYFTIMPSSPSGNFILNHIRKWNELSSYFFKFSVHVTSFFLLCRSYIQHLKQYISIERVDDEWMDKGSMQKKRN